jgi:hypothetical protein
MVIKSLFKNIFKIKLIYWVIKIINNNKKVD